MAFLPTQSSEASKISSGEKKNINEIGEWKEVGKNSPLMLSMKHLAELYGKKNKESVNK